MGSFQAMYKLFTNVLHHMNESASGQNEANPAF